MKTFDYLLNETLTSNNCEILLELNPYMLKRFFEFAFENDKFKVNILRNKKNCLLPLKKKYNPTYECVLMISCITTLSFCLNEIKLFQNLYLTYLNYKIMASPWKGRNEWYDFHKNIYSHLIWNDCFDIINWIWQQNDVYLENYINKNSNISRWRKNWYKTYQRNLKLNITKLCLFSEKYELLLKLICHNILNPKLVSFKNILLEYGYIYKNQKLEDSEFSNTLEWKWITEKKGEIDNLNYDNLFNICSTISKYKNRYQEYICKIEPTKLLHILHL